MGGPQERGAQELSSGMSTLGIQHKAVSRVILARRLADDRIAYNPESESAQRRHFDGSEPVPRSTVQRCSIVKPQPTRLCFRRQVSIR